MTVHTKYCAECGERNNREKGIYCSECLEEKRKDVIERYKKNNKEKMKEITKRYHDKHKKKCKYCGRLIWLDSTRCRHCARFDRKKKKIRVDKSGYIQIYSPKNPNADHRGYVYEHRLVVEKKIGRYLKKEEAVHHIDGDKSNNQIENLMLFPTHKEHMKFHTKIIQFGYTGPVSRQIEERWKNQK